MQNYHFSEDIRSSWTSGLFVGLAVVFLALFVWRYAAAGWKFLTGLLLFLGILFIFYVLNYRTLRIRLDQQALTLQFGLVRWRTEYSNIEDIQEDDSPLFIKYGGAGVHFAFVQGSYRAFFNFLEYPRLLVRFKNKQGWVEQLSFTTRHPNQIQELIKERLRVS